MGPFRQVAPDRVAPEAHGGLLESRVVRGHEEGTFAMSCCHLYSSCGHAMNISAAAPQRLAMIFSCCSPLDFDSSARIAFTTTVRAMMLSDIIKVNSCGGYFHLAERSAWNSGLGHEPMVLASDAAKFIPVLVL